jgi:hypothetical protein
MSADDWSSRKSIRREWYTNGYFKLIQGTGQQIAVLKEAFELFSSDKPGIIKDSIFKYK